MEKNREFRASMKHLWVLTCRRAGPWCRGTRGRCTPRPPPCRTAAAPRRPPAPPPAARRRQTPSPTPSPSSPSGLQWEICVGTLTSMFYDDQFPVRRQCLNTMSNITSLYLQQQKYVVVMSGVWWKSDQCDGAATTPTYILTFWHCHSQSGGHVTRPAETGFE